MIRTAEEARAELKRMGLPQIFEQISHRQIPIALAGTCEPVKRYFDLLPGLADRLPACQSYVPLWETNLDTVVAYDSKRDLFVRYYYGSASDEHLGTSYQQFLTAFLLELIDSGVWDGLEELAQAFGYKHLDELRAFVASCGDDDFEGLNRRFVSSIRD